MKFVNLDGNCYSNGFKLGSSWKNFLRKRISNVNSIRKRNKINESILNSRVKAFTGILKSVSANWLEEAKGISDAAGINLNDYLKINCLPADFLSSAKAGNCTSFISIGKKHNMLFKIRDERNHIQTFYTKKVGDFYYQSGHDIGNIGVAHFFSSRGLAGANNTGSVTEDITEEPALSDCHILRYIAERASSVEKIPDLIEKLINKGITGGAGKRRGSIFLLADKERGIALECTSKDFTYKFIDEGVFTAANHFTLPEARKWESEAPDKNTLLRKKRIDELLHGVVNENDLKRIFDLSRDRKYVPHALCNDDLKHFWMTISAQLQIIDKNTHENSINYACCGNTRHSFFMPFPISETRSFEPLLSGKYYSASDALYKRFKCDNHMKKIQAGFEKQVISRQCDYGKLNSDAYSILKSI